MNNCPLPIGFISVDNSSLPSLANLSSTTPVANNGISDIIAETATSQAALTESNCLALLNNQRHSS